MRVRWLRLTVRVFRALAVAYTVWRGLMRGRWLFAGLALWRILWAKRDDESAVRDAALQFFTGGEPAIYRRKGWRKLESRKSLRNTM